MDGNLFYNNQWKPATGESFQSINPADGTTLWSGKTATTSDIECAVKSARNASHHWATLSFEEREEYVLCFGKHLKAEEKNIAELIAKETGKPLWEATQEVKAMQSKIDSSIKAYHERTGNKSATLPSGEQTLLKHRAHGVLAIFGPYNFPGHLPNGHMIPALLAGNTLVLKPSNLTPATGEWIINLWHRCNMPSGVLNLVQGETETGKVLASHPDINGLLFTGSSKTGNLLHQQFAGHPEKILALEMGGNNPLIVDDSIDIQAAVYGIIQSSFITSGQRCTCARRLFVPIGSYGDQLLNTLITTTSHLKVGSWNDKEQPFMGPLISSEAASMVLQAQENLAGLGGTPLLSAKRLSEGNAWLTPGIMDVSDITELPDKEYFGPLVQVIRYQDFNGAVEQANQTRYGLSAGLFSQDREKFEYFYQHINAGIINWNRQTTGAVGAAPFGGVGSSGNHRPSAWYAADYCAYPVASIQADRIALPKQLAPGITLSNI